MTPSTVTWLSCMHSSSAACVFGDARLTSSTSRRFAKTGPGRNSNSFARWSKTLTPVTSDGSRSGVNCSRENEQSSERASAFASIVFPTPGKSSMIRCPSATRQRTTSRSVSSGAWTTRPRFATIARDEVRGRRAATRRLSQAGAPPRRGSPPRSRPSAPWRRRARRPRAMSVTSLSAGVEADVGARDVVEDEQVGVLARELLARALEPALALVGREADEHLARDARARRAPRGRRSSARARPSRRSRSFGRFARERLRRAVVGDGGGHDHDVGLGSARERLALELGRGRRLDELDARRRRHGEVRAEQRHVARRAAAPRRRARRPSGRTSGCRRSARRRSARAFRRRRRARACRAAARCRRAAPRAARTISSGSAIRPTPSSPSAVSPSSGPTSTTPRARSVSAFARVAGCDHMRGFIAGATSIGPRCASAASVSTLSASPCASFASVFAVHGATSEQVGARQVEVDVLGRRAAARARGTSRR